MDEHWSDSPEVFLEAIAFIKNKFPDSTPAAILARALEQGIGLEATQAEVFGRMLDKVTEELQGLPPNIQIQSADIIRATEALNVCVVVDYSYDLDYLAGYAQQDPKKIYIDSGFTHEDVAPFLVVHEAIEKCLLDYVQFSERAYQHAHQLAQYLEHAAIEAAGITWDDYQHKLMPAEIERAMHKTLEHVPPDLDLTPYLDTNDPKIVEVEALMRARHFDVSLIGTQVYHLQFFDAKRMARTLMRFQEFYESKEFKGKYFIREEFGQWYKDTRGAAYEDHWAEGFNFPGSVLKPFYEGHFLPLTVDEQQILNFFRSHQGETLYVIATAKDSVSDTLGHEIAHALYFVDAEYKKEVDKVLASTDLTSLKHFLQTDPEYGVYHEAVLNDECQAYLSQSSDELREHGFDTISYAELIGKLQALYNQFAPKEEIR